MRLFRIKQVKIQTKHGHFCINTDGVDTLVIKMWLCVMGDACAEGRYGEGIYRTSEYYQSWRGSSMLPMNSVPK
jgi:hypothetical protein